MLSHREQHEEMMHRHRAENPWLYRMMDVYSYMAQINPFLFFVAVTIFFVFIPSVGSTILFIGSLFSLMAQIRQRFFVTQSLASSGDQPEVIAQRDRQTFISMLWAIFQQFGVLLTIVGLVVIAVTTAV